MGDGFLSKLGLSRADATRLAHSLDPIEHDPQFQTYVKLSVVRCCVFVLRKAYFVRKLTLQTLQNSTFPLPSCIDFRWACHPTK